MHHRRAPYLASRFAVATATAAAALGCSGDLGAPNANMDNAVPPNSMGSSTAGPGATTPGAGAPGTGNGVAAPGSPAPGAVTPTSTDPGSPPAGVAPGMNTEGTSSATNEPAPVSGDVDEQCASLGAGVHSGVTKLRRLTQAQFNNTVRDLLGIEGTPASAFSQDERIGPFQSNAIAAITPLLVQQHDEVAISLSEQAVPLMASLASCDLTSGGEACASQFVAEFGTRAYRRPLTPDERSAYESLFATGVQEGGTEEGFRLVVATMLASPTFMYHVDAGINGTPSNTPTPLTSYELASRLSYFLWNTMPDQTLFDLAAADALQDDAAINAQVERMLADDRAKDAIPYFHLQWLGINTLDGINKDEQLFPQFDSSMAQAMTQETVDFTDYVVRQGDGLMSTLFTADFSFPSGPLLQLYGMQAPAGMAAGTPVPMDTTQRMGMLTQAAFLTRHAHENQTSPVHRGIVIRENLLCTPIDSPPPDVNNVPPEPTPVTTTRERFAQHSSDPTCAGCHLLTDPIGLGLENYDPIGAWRTQDGLSDVDATGEFLGTGDTLLDGKFDGGIELSTKLGNSAAVAECLANQWFRFATGRLESGDDACTMQQLQTGFAASNHNVRQLITEIALSDAFRHVRYVNIAP